MDTQCIYWLKRDFRLADNPALTAALAAHETVFAVFILEPSALEAPETSEFHVHAQCDAFNGLYQRIKAGGGALGFVHGEVVPTLARLHAATGFTTLHSHQETGGNRTYDRDRAVAAWCRENGVAWTEHLQTGVFRGPLDRDKRHRDWDAFTKSKLLPAPSELGRLRIPATVDFATPPQTTQAAEPALLAPREYLGGCVEGPLHPTQFGFRLTPEQAAHVQPVNEAAAHETLSTFLSARALGYSKGMSSPNKAFYHCSRLSVHFAWGTMSGRTAYQTVSERLAELKNSKDKKDASWRSNLRSFLSRLHWRDHFSQRLETEVAMEHRPLNPNFWEIDLENDPALLEAWITGHTGYPMVDACIRCMRTTGYINFRMRAMLTSTAAHMLHLDFRSIDKPMARLYTDYEPGIHLAQLQMQAGMVGINTLRTYSPEKQFLDHDPEAVFVHRWIPELRPFSAAEIAGRDLEKGLGDYPPVVVDRTERVRAYRKIIGDLKFAPGGKEITERVFAKHGSRRGPRKKKKTAATKAKATNSASS